MPQSRLAIAFKIIKYLRPSFFHAPVYITYSYIYYTYYILKMVGVLFVNVIKIIIV